MPSPLVLSFRDANQRYGVSAKLGWELHDDVSVYQGDIELPHFDFDTSGPCIVTGNLSVVGDIVGMDEGGGYLIVLGSCRARNLLIGGPQVWVQGDLTVEKSILADYNHGSLDVQGDIVTTIICAEHIVRVGGTIKGLSVDFGGLRVAAAGFQPTLSRAQAVYEATTYFVPEAFNEQGFVSGRRLFELMLNGDAILTSK